MKKLYLIRHSKSSWRDLSLEDFGRPLSKRGKNDCKLMGKILKRDNIKPNLILSSPAKRASKTALSIANEIGYDLERIKFDIKIYKASLNELLNIIRNIDEKDSIVFLIGHNPSLNLLTNYLVKENNIENIFTTSIVEFVFENNWSEIKENSAKIASFDYPKRHY